MMPNADTLPPLLSTLELEQLQQRILERQDAQRRAVTSPDIGPYRSAYRGQGMELYDVRQYQAGDDIRHVDWRATARSGRPVSKVFVEERASRVLLVLDRRTPMLFGTRREPKMASGARVAAMLLFSAIAARESVRGILLEDTARQFPFAHSLDQSLILLNALSAAPATADSRQAPLRQTLQELLHSEPSSTVVYVISDFHDIDTTETRLWSTLGERFDTHAIHVTDTAEEQLDDTGRIRLTSPVSGQSVVIDTHDPRLRKAYLAATTRRRQALANLFATSAIRYRTLYTDQDPFMTLGDWL